MKVVLLKDVKGLGCAGDLVEAKSGYANNYLFKNNLAAEATPQNLNDVKTRQKAEAAKAHQLLVEATETGKKLRGKKITLKVKTGEGGRLYGTITNQDVADELKSKGFEVDKRSIQIKTAIKGVGTYECEVRLHPEVTVPFVLDVQAEA